MKSRTTPDRPRGHAKLKRGIPGRIARIRGKRSQRAFARELGVFQQNVNRYENGTTPAAEFMITLALKEGVSIDWLLWNQKSQLLLYAEEISHSKESVRRLENIRCHQLSFGR